MPTLQKVSNTVARAQVPRGNSSPLGTARAAHVHFRGRGARALPARARLRHPIRRRAGRAAGHDRVRRPPPRRERGHLDALAAGRGAAAPRGVVILGYCVFSTSTRPAGQVPGLSRANSRAPGGPAAHGRPTGKSTGHHPLNKLRRCPPLTSPSPSPPPFSCPSCGSRGACWRRWRRRGPSGADPSRRAGTRASSRGSRRARSR